MRDLSAVQWKSGIAAWLGWLFDGLDMQSVHARGGTLRGRVARRPTKWTRSDQRRLLQLLDSGGVPRRLGPGRQLLWAAGRSARPQPGVDAHHPDLRPVHRPVVFCPNLVATDDLPISGRAGHRRRMGRRLGADFRNLAPPLASLAGGRVAKRRESREPCWPAWCVFVMAALPPRCGLSGRRFAGAARALDSPRRSRARRVACRQGPCPRGRTTHRRPVPRPRAEGDAADRRGLLAVVERPLGLHLLVFSVSAKPARGFDLDRRPAESVRQPGDPLVMVSSIVGNFLAAAIARVIGYRWTIVLMCLATVLSMVDHLQRGPRVRKVRSTT